MSDARAHAPASCQSEATTIAAALDQITVGLAPIGQAVAWLDWALHLANAPFFRAGLAPAAFDQWQPPLMGAKILRPLADAPGTYVREH